MSESDNYEYTEEKTKDFTCIDEQHHTYISISDVGGYSLKAGEGRGKYHWTFYLNGGYLSSKDFDTKEEALDWFDEKFLKKNGREDGRKKSPESKTL